jgi:hypothetical protein
MRRLLMLVVCGLLLVSLGCKEKPKEEGKRITPGRMPKIGAGGNEEVGPKPGGGAPVPKPNPNP